MKRPCRSFSCCVLIALTASLGVDRGASALDENPQTVTVLNACQSRDDLKYFVTRLQAVDVRLSSEHSPSGKNALRLEFFTGIGESDPEPKVLCTYARGSFALTNWKPHDRFDFDAYNPHGFSEALHLRLSDTGGHECLMEFSLPPAQWTTVSVPITRLAEKIDVSRVAALVFFLRAAEMKQPAQVVHLRQLRLAGSDREAIRRAAEAAGSVEDRRIPDPPITTRAAYLPVLRDREGAPAYRLRTQISVATEAEVVVIGGGAAGVPAAIAASRNGANVLLIEASGCLGGTSTLAFPPPQYGSGRLDRGGIFAELDKQVAALRPLALDPEARKYALDKAAVDAGVRLLLGTTVTDVILGSPTAEGNATIEALVVQTPRGRWAVRAKIFVDCTGDADVAAAAGAPFEMGRGRDEYTQAMSRLFYVGRGTQTQHKNLMTGTVAKVDPTRITDVTYAELCGRERALTDSQAAGPDQYLLTSPQIGIRESRRIVGEYVLTGKDVVSGARFDDVVACCQATMDSWCAEGEWDKVYTDDVNSVWLKDSYDIPFRCLIPQRISNMLVAGRAISMTHAAQSSARLQPTCGLLGQAAGTVAAMCAALDQLPRQVDVGRLQVLLTEQGVVLRDGIPAPEVTAKWSRKPLATRAGRPGGYLPEVGFDAADRRVTWDKDVPILYRAQVLVVGGSPAGLAAAAASAQRGAQTLLVGQAGFLGGNVADSLPFQLPPLAERREDPFAAWCTEMARQGARVGEVIDPEQFRHLADRMIEASGAKLLVRALPIDVLQGDSGREIRGLVVHTKSGPIAIEGDCIVDCTEGANVATMAGARLQRPPGKDRQRGFLVGVPTGQKGEPPHGMVWGPGRKWLCGVVRADVAPLLAFTEAQVETRRRLWDHMAQLRTQKGYEEAILLSSSCDLETPSPQCIEGLASLGEKPSGQNDLLALPAANTLAGPVPLGSLMPRDCPHVLVAGRSVATTLALSGAVRPVAVQTAIGNTAGIVAALAAQRQKEPSSLDPEEVKEALSSSTHSSSGRSSVQSGGSGLAMVMPFLLATLDREVSHVAGSAWPCHLAGVAEQPMAPILVTESWLRGIIPPLSDR